MVRNLCLLLLTTHCLSGLIAVNAAPDDEPEKKESANEEGHSSIDTESKQENQQKAAFPHPEVSTSLPQKRQRKPLIAQNFEYDAFTTSSSSSSEGDGKDKNYSENESEAESDGAESLVKSSSSSGEDSDKLPNDEDSDKSLNDEDSDKSLNADALDEWFKKNVALTKSKARKSSLALGPSKGPNKSGKKPNQPRQKTMITLSSSSSDSDQPPQNQKAPIQSKKGLAHKSSIQQQKQGPKVIMPKATSQRKDPSGEKVGSSESLKNKMAAPQTKAPRGKKSTNSAETRKGKGQVPSLSEEEIDLFIKKLTTKRGIKKTSSDEDNKPKNKDNKPKNKDNTPKNKDNKPKNKDNTPKNKDNKPKNKDNKQKDVMELSDNSLDFNLSDDSLNVSSPEEKKTPKKGKRTKQPQNKKRSGKEAESKSGKAGGTKATPTQKKQKKLR